MGIWDRLGNVIKSHINDEERVFTGRRHSDPDLNAAYEELDDYLNREKAWKDFGGAEEKRKVPEELRQDFAELGLTPEAGAEQCKEAYKRLLKIHHPDRHAAHEGNAKKATEKSVRINAAYERLMKWFSFR
jgi:DnaJ-domain-containing protein 1